jgi:hypothetical protein
LAAGSIEGFGQDLEEMQIAAGGAQLEVEFGPGGFDLPREAIERWIQRAAQAVTKYYGRFPVPRMRIRINSSDRRGGAFGGTTWGKDPPFTRISVGRHATQEQLDTDWLLTHELIHTAFPDVDEEHHWIEEGIAVYVEPIARVQSGYLAAREIWNDMLRDMPKGQPQTGDEGLDHTHSWGRTYWGGALFCLTAEVQIRRSTHNRAGLQDALRAIRDAGGTIQNHWPLERAFAIGDRATGTKVLSEQYAKMKDQAVTVDLPALWRELGVQATEGSVRLDEQAPLASIRRAITAARPA